MRGNSEFILIVSMAITNKIGAPVTGEDFYGRSNELSRAYRYLNERQSLLLSAPRRIGKSSFAKKLIAEKSVEDWKCVYIDLQGIATKEAFLRKLIDSFTGAGLMEQTGKRVKEFMESFFTVAGSVELGKIKIDLNQRSSLEAMYNRLSETFDYEQDTLIVIDELPLFLGKLIGINGENRDEVEFLLNWFRSLRQHENSRLRWLFCGSVGLRNFTTHYRMSQTINDLADFELGALTDDEARGLIHALSHSYQLSMTDEVVDKTLNLLQWPIPYFIQLLIDRLISGKQNDGEVVVGINDIEAAIEELSRSDYFMTWYERLYEYRNLEPIARLVLNNVSAADVGLSKDMLLQILMKGHESADEPAINENLTKVLEMLEHDGYLMRNDRIRKFRSPLLRKWWKYKFID